MELTWKGYVITVRVQRTQIEGTPDPAMKEVPRPPSPEPRRDVDKEYLLASGNRHIAPTR